MTALVHVTTLTETSCWCGIAVAIPDSLYREARERGHEVYCPLGHTFVFRDTETDRLRKELQRTKDRLASANALADRLEMQRRAQKAQVTKLRKRIVAGACPFGCHRHFADLERHVATKHPGAVLDAESVE